MYGTQTAGVEKAGGVKFENDVKMYGTQTQEVGKGAYLPV